MSNVFSGFEIPASFTISTGGEEQRTILERRDEFFMKAVRHLGLCATRNPFIAVHTLALSIRTELMTTAENIRRSDDWLHELVVCHEPLALVLDRRDDGNYHQVSFWVNEPSTLALEDIRHLRRVSEEVVSGE